MPSLLFFLELECRLPPQLCFGCMWDARVACPRVFCCTLPLLLMFCWWILVVLFRRFLSLCYLAPSPCSLRVSCCVVVSPPPWPCPLTDPWVPRWLPPNPCEGGDIPPLLLQLSALRRVPRGPLHLLSVVKASQALAVAQWSCRQHPQAFLASTLSGSSRCWDLSKPLRPWEQENGRLT